MSVLSCVYSMCEGIFILTHLCLHIFPLSYIYIYIYIYVSTSSSLSVFFLFPWVCKKNSLSDCSDVYVCMCHSVCVCVSLSPSLICPLSLSIYFLSSFCFYFFVSDVCGSFLCVCLPPLPPPLFFLSFLSLHVGSYLCILLLILHSVFFFFFFPLFLFPPSFFFYKNKHLFVIAAFLSLFLSVLHCSSSFSKRLCLFLCIFSVDMLQTGRFFFFISLAISGSNPWSWASIMMEPLRFTAMLPTSHCNCFRFSQNCPKPTVAQ